MEKSDKPAPERFDEDAVARRDDVHVHGPGALRCPFCHDAVDVDAAVAWVACERCLARHHEPCWHEAGRCGGCAHEVALAGRLGPASGAPPRSAAALRIALAAGLIAALVLMAGGVVAYVGLRRSAQEAALLDEARVRARVGVEADQRRAREAEQRRALEAERELAGRELRRAVLGSEAALAEEIRKREEAQRMFVNQAEATRAAVELAEGQVTGPRRVDVVGGYAIVDGEGSWIFVDTTGGDARLVAAGLGTTFLEAEGPEVTCAQPGGVPYALSKAPGPPGAVMVLEGSERPSIFDVTPAERDAIVAALAAPPGEVDIAALLVEHGYVRRAR